MFDEISINNLKTGIYKINISYLGDVNHVSVSYLEDIKVNSVISESNIIVLTNKDYSVIENSSDYVKKYTISFENKTVNVVMDTRCEFTVYVNGNKFINKTNLKLYSHDLGAYINIKVKLDDKNDVGDEFESVVKIKSSSAISYDDNKISLNLPSDAKGKVILTINNKTYESALNNLNIFNLTDGDYNYSIAYSGDDKYESFTYEGNVPVINTYKTNITLSSNIVGYNGNVIVKVNGEGNLNNYLITVSGIGADKLLKLDKKGQCILSLRNIKPGSYKIKIVFNGDNKYLSSSLISKITITKAKVKLIAKKKTFKANVKVKKYKIILKGVKKAKVILKIKGKKYSAKTNNKGKAIFKLKKLNIKGKYKAKIQFRGNKYYNSAKKTVIIKIK